MTIAVELGDFVKAVANGDQNIPITTDLSSAPAGSWAVLFWGDTNGVSGTFKSSSWGMVGMVANGGASISEYGVGWYMAGGAATSDTARRMAAACLTRPEPSLALNCQANFVGFTSPTNMRINWSTAGTDSGRIFYAIISGLENAKVVDFTLPAGTGNKTITGAGFTPTLAVFLSAFTTAVPASTADSYLSFGVANAASSQWGNAIASRDASAASDCARYQRTDSVLLAPQVNAGGEDVRASLSSFNGDGAVLNFAVNAFGSSYHGFALFMAGSDLQSKVGSFNKSTGGAPAAQTLTPNQAFVPAAALFANDHSASSTSVQGDAIWALGMSTVAAERAMGLYDQDADDPTDVMSVFYTDKAIVVPKVSGAASALADLTALDANSFDLNWTTNEAIADEILYLLIGGGGQTHQMVMGGP